MSLRYVEDKRALFWTLVLFPAVPAIDLAFPFMAPWLLPFGLYLSYCAGVLTHNHNHCPVFTGRRANAWYSAWLSVFYGYPTFSWIPTHNQNHHRYVNGPGDDTRTTRWAEKDSLFGALTYPLASAVYQAGSLRRFVARAREKNPARYREMRLQWALLVGTHAALFGLAVALHGPRAGALTYALAAGVPALSATWFMMFTNYVQHVGCDPSSPDNHSRNFVSPSVNWLVFNGGYHTVHHEHPGVHWSRYPAMHRARAHRISPELNQDTILSYCLRTYVLGRTGSSPATDAAVAAE